MNEIGLFLLIMTPLFLVMMLMPYLTRKTESFGVSIPHSFYSNEILKKLRHHYMVWMIIVNIITGITLIVLAMALSLTENALAILFSAVISGYLIGSFIIYLVFHRRMKTIKKKEAW